MHPEDLTPKQRRTAARHWQRLQVTLPGMGTGRISTRNPIKESLQ